MKRSVLTIAKIALSVQVAQSCFALCAWRGTQDYLRTDPDSLHYYHGRATRVVPGGVEVFFGGDPTSEST